MGIIAKFKRWVAVRLAATAGLTKIQSMIQESGEHFASVEDIFKAAISWRAHLRKCSIQPPDYVGFVDGPMLPDGVCRAGVVTMNGVPVGVVVYCPREKP